MNLAPVLKQRYLDANGVPLAGGLLYSYVAGTTTPLATYSNAAGTPNANPVVLDSQGYADVWLDPTLAYKFVLQNSAAAVQFTVDNVTYSFGVSTWNANTIYQQGQIVQDASGQGIFYVSLTNSNQGNALSSVANWRALFGNIRTLSIDTTLLVTDEFVRSNSTSGNRTMTLPACSTTPIGKRITIKDVGTGGNTTTVKGSGTDLVDGNNTYPTALSQYDLVAFVNTGTVWDASYVVQAGTITTAKLAALSVTAAKIANNTITATQIANATLTGTQVVNNISLPGKAAQVSGKNIVCSAANTTNGLTIIRGYVQDNGTILSGEGFTVTKTGTGTYQINITTTLGDNCVATVSVGNAGFNCMVSGMTTGIFNVDTYSSGTTHADCYFNFIVVGQRA